MFSSKASFPVTVIMLGMMTSNVIAQNIDLVYSIQEELPAMSPVGHIIADSNIGDLVPSEDLQDLRFTFLREGYPDSDYLWLNATSGQVRTRVRIDRESVCRMLTVCQLSVQAAVQSQLGAFFRIVTIRINISDINDNPPTFSPSTYTIRIPEDERVGSHFPLPTALDLDMGPGNSIVVYNVAQTVPPFTLVSNSNPPRFDLQLRLNNDLDREITPSYEILLLAVDGGSTPLTGTLTITVEVLDVNDNAPIFRRSLYAANISEITPVGSVVLVVDASDLDSGPNGAITYFLPSPQADPVIFTMFEINATSGEFKTLIPLDTYAGKTYSMKVHARDNGPTPRTDIADVVISILDTHNSNPEILLNVFGDDDMARVSEKAELGRTVAHVAIMDPDAALSPNGMVTCTLDSDQFQLQAMDIDQYKIILIQRLDRETQAFHSVTVQCEDAGVPPLNTSSSFIVEVEDENDSPPIFEHSSYVADVVEGQRASGSSPREVLVQVRATDRDTGLNAQLNYRLADGTDSDFGIYTDGSIVVTNRTGVDREDPRKGAVRELVVLAVDEGRPPQTGTTTVTVTIRDINDNPPKFSFPEYYFRVTEGAEIGTVVNSTSATDADLEINAIFYFRMDEDDVPRVPFEVGLDGVIKVSDDIDRETKSNYEFRVIAYDLGEPAQLSSTVTVHVGVDDINDNSPVFIFPNDDNFTLYVPHTLGANTAFAKISATDSDEGKNSELVYARDVGNGSRFFDIIPETGAVVLMRPLSLNQLGPHFMAVVAHDLGEEKEMATQSLLQINVYEGNATLPVQDEDGGFRNVVVVVVLVATTLLLGLAILLTIVLIRRLDRQRRLYNTKDEETKADSNLRHLNPGISMSDTDASTSLSDIGGDSKDAGKKKKEVSFSLDEDNNINAPPAMTTFNPMVLDKYDPIPDKDRGNMKNDSLACSNHYNRNNYGKKNTGMKKEVNTFNFHQVHPAPSVPINSRQQGSGNGQPRQHEDNLSDVSADVSTSDSGRGGSDVELQSHGGVSKDPGDTSFASQRGFSLHNNLSASTSNGSNNSNRFQQQQQQPPKFVHFQNIRPDPVGTGSFSNPSPPPSLSSRPPRGHSHAYSAGLPSRGGSSRFTPNLLTDDDGSYVKLANRSGRLSNPSNQELERHRNQILSDNFYPTQNSRLEDSATCDGEYMDMGGVKPCLSQRSNSNSCLDGAGAWDGDTTTSGSYTIDPQELRDEIDKLFFEEIKDVVV